MSIIEMPKVREGCAMILKQVEVWDLREKAWRPRYIYCDKICEPGEALCPHHKLLEAEIPLEKARKAKRAAATRERNRMRKEALENSPLAIKPSTRSGHTSTYGDSEAE